MHRSSGPIPTIREVAEKAATSIATASKALNNKGGYLRPELRERVLQAARELGYVRNAAASSLKGMRRGIIAVLVPQFGNDFFTRICIEVEAVAQQAGYVVTICNSDDEPAQEHRIVERLISQQIDGCIISPAASRSDSLALLRRHRIPAIVLERSLGEVVPECDFVGHDNFDSGYRAAESLLRMRHRRIAFAGWDSPVPNIHDRARGYVAALRESGVIAPPEWLLLDDLSLRAGRRMADKIIRLDVTGLVIAHHQGMAKGLLMELLDRGLRWPEDLSIVLIGTPDWRDLVRPSLACIERPEGAMGREAALSLLRKVADPDSTGPATILTNQFVAGGSLGHPPTEREFR
jgi:LacI family transcriptional regulator